MSGITTHVLDTALGRPADGVTVILETSRGEGNWRQVGSAETDADGRAGDLLRGEPRHAGTYRLRFETGAYFERLGTPCFHPRVEVMFTVADASRPYHVPLLLSPFGYTTYRGS